MSNLKIEGLCLGSAFEIDDSIIRITEGATLTLSSVIIKNFKLIGNNKYGTVVNLDLTKSVLNEKGKFDSLSVSNVVFDNVITDGTNAHGDNYYFIFKEEQVEGDKLSDKRLCIISKLNLDSPIEDSNKIYYSVDNGVTSTDLNGHYGPFHVIGVGKDSNCGKYSVDPCSLSNALDVGEDFDFGAMVQVCVDVDNAIVTTDTYFSVNKVRIGYYLMNDEGEDVSIVLGMKENSTSAMFVCSQNVYIRVNIYIDYIKDDTNSILISGENKKLTITGKDVDNPVRIGGKASNIDVSSSLLCVREKAVVELRNVIFQYATLKGKGRYGTGLTVDFRGLYDYSNPDPFTNIDIDNTVKFDDTLLVDEALGRYMYLIFSKDQVASSYSGYKDLFDRVKTLSGIGEEFYSNENQVYYFVEDFHDISLDLSLVIPDPGNNYYVDGNEGVCEGSKSYLSLIGCENFGEVSGRSTGNSFNIYIISPNITESSCNFIKGQVNISKDNSVTDPTSVINVQTEYNVFLSFEDYNSNITINKITFSFSDIKTPTVNVISLNGGNLYLLYTSFIMEGSNTLSASLIKSEECNLHSINSTFSGFTLSSGNGTVINIEGGADINSSNFTNIKGNKGYGGALHCSSLSNYPVHISSCIFTNCSTQNGNGGGIYSHVSSNSEFIISGDGGSNTIFKSCSALSPSLNNMKNDEVGSGRGGAMYLMVEQSVGQIRIDNVTFGSSNEEKNVASEKGGYDLFVYAYDLDSFLNLNCFGFAQNYSKNYTGVMGMSWDDKNITNIVASVSSNSDDDDDDGNSLPTVVKIIIIVVVVVVVLISIAVIIIVIMRIRSKKGGKEEKDKSKEKETEMEVDKEYRDEEPAISDNM